MPRPRWTTPLALVAAIFGAATLYSGGMALWGKAEMGNVVPFLLWFNFAMGAVYLVAAALIFRRHPAALPMAWAIGISTGLVFVAFVIVALSGTPFEMRTLGAMILRTGFWLGAAWALRRA